LVTFNEPLFFMCQVVAPFSGTAVRSKESNEVIMKEMGSLPPGTEMIITNIDLIDDIMHPDDDYYVEKLVTKYAFDC